VNPVGDSKSPEKYTINRNLVVNLNDSVVKPVKRENSNTTHATGITAATASTNNSNGAKNSTFYNTQYNKGNNNGKGGFFPSTTTGAANANISLGSEASDQLSMKM
jgi:hypothetical protein